ncbi:MAG: DEAD/DEAH box helicase [Nitrospirae bacterium]|nr:DEAD/DEAH box helicase [Nitrospirota bacterium]
MSAAVETIGQEGPWPGHTPTGEPSAGEDGPVEVSGSSALRFIEEHGDLLLNRVVDAYPPLYGGTVPPAVANHVAGLKRTPFPAQQHAIAALWTRLGEAHGVDAPFVGEMGVGKTLCALAQAHILIQEQFGGLGRILVLCPSHLLRKWQKEAQDTIPACETYILRTLSDIDHVFQGKLNGTQVLLLSKETAKLGMPRHATFWQSRSKRNGVFFCPHCGAGEITYQDPNRPHTEDRETHPPNPDSKKFPYCAECDAPLWTWTRLPGGRARYPLAEYIARRRYGIQVFIPDEVHQFKGGNTAQGAAFYRLSRQAKKMILATGTIVNGYSSSLFYLLYRISPEVRREFGFNEVQRWIELYGCTEKIIHHEEGDAGIVTRKHAVRETVRERPGISPLVFRYLLNRTVFLSLRDVHEALPDFEELPVAVPMSDSQKKLYEEIETGFRYLQGLDRDPKSMGLFLQVLLSWPDNPWKSEAIVNREMKEVYHVPALEGTSESRELLPKEEKLLDVIRTEARQRRKVFLFATFTGVRDVQPRLAEVLTRAGLRVTTLRSDTVKAEDRMEWIEQASKSSDVIIANPRLVEVGLDLIDFPTLIYYQSEYNLYTLRQSSRRSWRIGQTRPVKVYYFYYTRTAQEKATALSGKKLAAALMIDGESIPEQGLAAGEGSSILSELSDALMRNTQLPDIREIFAKSRVQGGLSAPRTNPSEYLSQADSGKAMPPGRLHTSPENGWSQGLVRGASAALPAATAQAGNSAETGTKGAEQSAINHVGTEEVQPPTPKANKRGQFLLF